MQITTTHKKAIDHYYKELASYEAQNVTHETAVRSSHLLLQHTNLVIPKEVTPGATAKHEGLHQCSFGLNSVHQIVCGPRMKQRCQGDYTQLRMLCSPFQVAILSALP